MSGRQALGQFSCGLTEILEDLGEGGEISMGDEGGRGGGGVVLHCLRRGRRGEGKAAARGRETKKSCVLEKVVKGA